MDKLIFVLSRQIGHVYVADKDLSYLQKHISEIVTQDPSLLESLVLQPQVEHLIKNPNVIHSMFSANPIINKTINVN